VEGRAVAQGPTQAAQDLGTPDQLEARALQQRVFREQRLGQRPVAPIDGARITERQLAEREAIRELAQVRSGRAQRPA
jgi:hypothetical protein